jgi:hypothetical protein
VITLAPHLPEVETARTIPQTRASQGSLKQGAGKSANKPVPAKDSEGKTEDTRPGTRTSDTNPNTNNDKSPTLFVVPSRQPLTRAIAPNSSEDNPSEASDQQPFHTAWNHALSQEDMTGVVSHPANLSGSQQAAQALKLPKGRINSDAVAVTFLATPPETTPVALSAPVPATSTPMPNRSGSSNPVASPPIENPNNSDVEAPAPSTDPVAFTARMRNSDEPAFEVPTGKSQIASVESQAVVVSAEPAVDPSAVKQITQVYEQAGAHTELAPAPGPAHSAPVQPIETPPIAPAALAPVKDLALHLGGPQNIEVRVSEKSGEIRVDVRTADPNLAQDLRGGLHELVSKLDSKGFTTAVSSPTENTITAARSGDASLSQDDSSGGQHSSAQQDEQQKQQQSRNQEAWSKRNQDSWLQTLSTNIQESQ